VSLSLEWLSTRAPKLLQNAQLLLAWIAEEGTDRAVTNNHDRLKHFLTHCAPPHGCVDQISQKEILNYQASPAAQNGRLAAVSGLLKLWFELEIPGVTADAYGLLHRLRLTGNVKGRAVRSMDPFDGPLTDLEREAMLARLGDAYEAGQISFEDYVFGLVFCSLAPRPVQVAALKIKDLSYESSSSGLSNFRLEVPRAKQRNELSKRTSTQRLSV
jgi:hypothetical protein